MDKVRTGTSREGAQGYGTNNPVGRALFILALHSESKILPVDRAEFARTAFKGWLENSLMFFSKTGWQRSIDRAQKSSANMDDLRGSILRVKPEDDGTYSIPNGNLFPKDGSEGRPEIYEKLGVKAWIVDYISLC